MTKLIYSRFNINLIRVNVHLVSMGLETHKCGRDDTLCPRKHV